MDKAIQEVTAREVANGMTADSTRSNYPHSPEYVWHHDLTAHEVNVLRNHPEDFPIFQVIHAIPRSIKEEICALLGHKAIVPYLQMQRDWVEQAKKYFALDHGRPPKDDAELGDSMYEKGTPYDFKLWAFVRHPEVMGLKGGLGQSPNGGVSSPLNGERANRALNFLEEFVADVAYHQERWAA
jgi:hypothetical protein